MEANAVFVMIVCCYTHGCASYAVLGSFISVESGQEHVLKDGGASQYAVLQHCNLTLSTFIFIFGMVLER